MALHLGAVEFVFWVTLRCRRISSEHPSTVLEKFIGFLEDALEDEDSDDE